MSKYREKSGAPGPSFRPAYMSRYGRYCGTGDYTRCDGCGRDCGGSQNKVAHVDAKTGARYCKKCWS